MVDVRGMDLSRINPFTLIMNDHTLEPSGGRWWRSLGTSKWRVSKGYSSSRRLVDQECVPFKGGEIKVIPREIAELIFEEYDGEETFELLHKHGGFDIQEALAALADIVERERGIS